MKRSQVMQRGVLAVCAAAAALLSGCGLFESAGEVTLAGEEIPRFKQRIDWPDVDELTGSALAGAAAQAQKDGKPLNAGLPSSLEQGTLAHVQGLMALIGDCQRTVEQPDFGKGSSASNLVIRLTNCSGDARCDEVCGGFRGMRLEASVTLQLLDDKKAANLASQLRQARPDAAREAIVQLRLRFYEMKLYQKGADGSEEDVTHRIDDLEMVIATASGELPLAFEGQQSVAVDADAGWAHWAKVLEGRFLDRIAPSSPQRFEIDPKSPLSEEFKDLLLAGKATSLRLVTRLAVSRPDLYELRFAGAGVEVDVQPEIVLSVLQLLKNL